MMTEKVNFLDFCTHNRNRFLLRTHETRVTILYHHLKLTCRTRQV